MQFGIVLASNSWRPLAPRMTKPQKTMEFLCDGGSKPNPGWAQPICHDGTKFILVPRRQVLGNHKAIYESVDFALEYAFNNDATDVVISTAANLVYNQLANDIMLNVLTGRHSATSTLARRFNSVLWVLVAPPFILPARPPVRSRKALRRIGRRAIAMPNVAVIPTASHPTRLVAAPTAASIAPVIPPAIAVSTAVKSALASGMKSANVKTP